MPKETSQIKRPIFLVSPPGSTEAKYIGYINIPKIVKEPPTELSELHNFNDTEDSHAWVLKSFIINPRSPHRTSSGMEIVCSLDDNMEDMFVDFVDSPHKISLVEHTKKVCESEKIPEKVIKTLLYRIDNAVSFKGASRDLGYSDTEYESSKKTIQRKGSKLRKYFSGEYMERLKSE